MKMIWRRYTTGYYKSGRYALINFYFNDIWYVLKGDANLIECGSLWEAKKVAEKLFSEELNA